MSKRNCYNNNLIVASSQVVLSGNRIVEVDRRAFVGLFSLESLYLDNNQLRTLENTTFMYLQPQRMQSIDLSGLYHVKSTQNMQLSFRQSVGV